MMSHQSQNVWGRWLEVLKRHHLMYHLRRDLRIYLGTEVPGMLVRGKHHNILIHMSWHGIESQ